jgi:hypothetical protein
MMKITTSSSNIAKPHVGGSYIFILFFVLPAIKAKVLVKYL